MHIRFTSVSLCTWWYQASHSRKGDDLCRWIYNNTQRRLLIDSQTQLSSLQNKNNKPKCYFLFSFTAWLEDWQMPWCCPALWFYEDFFFSLKWSTWTIFVKLLCKAQARFTLVECTASSAFPQGSFCFSFTFWHLPPKLSPAILNLSRGVFPCPCMASIVWPLHIW